MRKNATIIIDATSNGFLLSPVTTMNMGSYSTTAESVVFTSMAQLVDYLTQHFDEPRKPTFEGPSEGMPYPDKAR